MLLLRRDALLLLCGPPLLALGLSLRLPRHPHTLAPRALPRPPRPFGFGHHTRPLRLPRLLPFGGAFLNLLLLPRLPRQSPIFLTAARSDGLLRGDGLTFILELQLPSLLPVGYDFDPRLSRPTVPEVRRGRPRAGENLCAVQTLGEPRR
jgi:hypothetical protein